MSVKDHIQPGALCVLCRRAPATTLTRLVACEDGMPQDAMLWGAATCWKCAVDLALIIEDQCQSRKKHEN